MSGEINTGEGRENGENQEQIVAKISEIKRQASEDPAMWRKIQVGLKELRANILQSQHVDIDNSFIFHLAQGSTAPETVTDFDLSDGAVERFMEHLFDKEDEQN